MKRLFFLFFSRNFSVGLMVFAGLAVVVFHSCKKEIVQTPTNEEQHIYTAEELSIWRNLTEFNNKVKSGIRDEEFISPDSALWYLEALFNVQQATDTTFNELNSYVRSYSLSVNENGTVNMSEVTVVYNQMLTDLGFELEQIDTDHKFLIIADLSPSPVRDGDFIMDFTAGLGINPLAIYAPFNTDDNWRYGNMKGKCTNSQWDSDGGVELERRFNNPYMHSSGNAWINVDYTDNLSHIEYPNRIYYEEATSDPCMEYTELQHYLTQGHYIIYNTPIEVPSGEQKEGLTFKVLDLWTNNDNPSDGKYWHMYLIAYGEHITLPPIGD